MGLKPTCREVHRLISQDMDRNLPPIEAVRMHAHLLICGKCRKFKGQSRFLRTALRRLTPFSGERSFSANYNPDS